MRRGYGFSGELSGWLPDEGPSFRGKTASALSRMMSGGVSPLEMGPADLGKILSLLGPAGYEQAQSQALSNQYMDEREVMNPAANRGVDMARIGAQTDIANQQDARLRDQSAMQGALEREKMGSAEMLALMRQDAEDRAARAQQGFDIQKLLMGEQGKNSRAQMEAQGRIDAANARRGGLDFLGKFKPVQELDMMNPEHEQALKDAGGNRDAALDLLNLRRASAIQRIPGLLGGQGGGSPTAGAKPPEQGQPKPDQTNAPPNSPLRFWGKGMAEAGKGAAPAQSVSQLLYRLLGISPDTFGYYARREGENPFGATLY